MLFCCADISCNCALFQMRDVYVKWDSSMRKRTLFIKPTKPVHGEVNLDPVLVSRNKSRGVETTLTLDTNILISMEKIVDGGNKWALLKEHGLHNLVKLLQKCPPESVCISPGFAFSEMPPGLASVSREKYEFFCSTHLPGFIDVPNCVYTAYNGKMSDYGFGDLSSESQALLAIPYVSILYLNLIENTVRDKPMQKFNLFLDKVEESINVLSAAEAEIAKYCFVEPPCDCKDTIRIRKAIRKNFLKTNKGKLPIKPSEVMTIAFNAACDMQLLHVANILDQNGINGVRQDSWVATQDMKLAEFSSVFHHVDLDGNAGKFASRDIHPDHSRDEFWVRSDIEFGVRNLTRRFNNKLREFDVEYLLDSVHKAEAEIECAFR